MEPGKRPWESKTVWVGLCMAVAPFVPGVDVWMSQNISTVSMVWGALAILLRLVTKEKVQLVD